MAAPNRNFGVGRFSYAPPSNMRTPVKNKFTNMEPPQTGNRESRFSLGGVPQSARRQSNFKVQVMTAPKDTHDKAMQAEFIRKIHSFLVELDGDEAPSEATIRNPTQKDFVHMFESIYETVCSGYTVVDTSKLDVEIPRIFNALGYPFVIKGTTLKSMGAPHSWHYLLHALTWLIDFVQLASGQDVSQILLGGDNSNGTVRGYRYAWQAATFREFSANKNLIHSEDWQDGKREALSEWFTNQEDVEGGLRAANATLEQLKKECEELKEDKGHEERYKIDIHRVTEDIRKTVNYLEMSESACQQAQATYEVAAAETEEVRKEVLELRRAVVDKKRLIEEQEKGDSGITGEQARVIMTEIDQNRVHLRELHCTMDSLSKENWQKKPRDADQFAHLLTSYSRLISDVHSVRRRLLDDQQAHDDEPRMRDIKELYVRLRDDVARSVHATRDELETKRRAIAADIQTFLQRKKNLENRIVLETEKLDDHTRSRQRRELEQQRVAEKDVKERRILQSVIDKLLNEKDVLEMKQRQVAELEQQLIEEKSDKEDAVRSMEDERLALETELSGRSIEMNEQFEKLKQQREFMVNVINKLNEKVSALPLSRPRN